MTETPLISPTVLPSQEFDKGMKTATPTVLARMKVFQAELRLFGVDMADLVQQAKTASRREALSVWRRLHETAVIFFIQWQRARQEREEADTLAWARLVNEVTHCARALHEQYGLVSREHIADLVAVVKRDEAAFDVAELAQKMAAAAAVHTHDRAWPWVVLPTFPRQPYGRILLAKVEVGEDNLPVFITQPFFLSGKCTLFHTHGQNWALSRPLGNKDGANKHINTLWLPHSAERPFPLMLTDFAEYNCADIAVIPPRLIHGISKKRGKPGYLPALAEIYTNSGLREQLVEASNFGECSCLHMYYPCTSLARELHHSPLVLEDERFFIEYDMIVFDHYEGTIWSGGGGSWPRRMVEFGRTGEHCGICFEDDPRRENLDPQVVWEWLVGKQSQEILKFSHAPVVV